MNNQIINLIELMEHELDVAWDRVNSDNDPGNQLVHLQEALDQLRNLVATQNN